MRRVRLSVALGVVLLVGVARLSAASCTFQWTAPTTYVDGTVLLPGTVITYKLVFKDGANVTTTKATTTAVTAVLPTCDPGDYWVVAVNTFGTDSAKSNIVSNKVFAAVINVQGFMTP